ncbi:MAG: tetratricopeptide repeat protein [Leptospiraceae bacterium]|nr:tetratricopeptide repeat protein [Leptospiraceae bacterium]
MIQNIYLILILLFFQNCSFSEDSLRKDAKEEMAISRTDSSDSSRAKILLSDGTQYYYEGKYKEAIEKSKEANSILPTEDGYYLLGLSLYKNKDYLNAKKALESGLELNPKSELILVSYALALTAAGEEEEALFVYTKLSDYFREKEIYTFKQGISLKSLKRYEESFLVFTKINEESFPYKPQLYMYMGEVCFEMKKYSQAEGYFVKANQVDPNMEEAKDARAKAKFALAMENGNVSFLGKKYSVAIVYYLEATILNTKDSKAFFKLGESFYNNLQFAKAEENLKRSISLEKKNKEAYSLLSSLYAKTDKYEASIAILKNAMEEFPNDKELYNQLGISYGQIGKMKLALLSFMKAKEIDRNYLTARINLGILMLKEKKLLEAKHEFRELQELSPNDKFIKEKVAAFLRAEKENSESNSNKKKKTILAISKTKEEEEAYRYLKKGQESLAREAFLKIIEKNPESAFSYYQLGVLSLSQDRQTALRYFEKAIAMNSDYSSAYIARGITYYKLGNRERAKEDFHYALSLDSEKEIASYNLGMILYNDNLTKDAETIFLDLTQEYPDFADPYYHLGYMYYEQKKLEQAEKYILISLRLERNPSTIYAYLMILNAIQKSQGKRESIDKQIQTLKKEIVEKYPSSTYAKNLSESVFQQKDNHVVMQSYPLQDKIITPPIYINQSLVVNHGTSIARLRSDSKSILWRVETPISYHTLKANTRLYGISKTHLDQFDLETGKLLWHLKLNPNATERFMISDSILSSAIVNGREVIHSYSMEGDFQSSLKLDMGSKWELTSKGSLFVFHATVDGISWEIYDAKLNLLKNTLTLIGAEKGDLIILGSLDNSCYVLSGNYIYRFDATGEFKRSLRVESTSIIYLQQNTIFLRTDTALFALSENLDKWKKIQTIDKNQDEFLVGENTYLSEEGILTVRDTSGNLFWSENLSKRADKGKSSIYSVYFRK